MPTGRMLLGLLVAIAAPARAAPITPVRAKAETVVVRAAVRKALGGGLIKPQTQAKSVSTISSVYIGTQAAIQNAYQYVALAPGANVSAVDPYGLSEDGSINLRGLGQDELGYVLEGMPLNDIGYYTAYPSQFIDSENIDEISLAQGSADLDSPVISAAGGLLTLSMLDPSLHSGGSIDASYGSYHANREFIRLDSGLLGDSGVRAFISYSHTGADNWRGSGRDKRTHVDYKLVREWGDGNRISLVGTYHDGVTTGYPRPTLGQFQTLGRSYNYDGTYTPGDGNYWRLNVGTFRVLYMSAPSKFTLADHLKLDVTPYWQYGYGNSPFGETLSETGNFQGTEGPYTVSIPNSVDGVGTVEANYQDLQYRAGVVAKLTATLGRNSFVAGYWYDYADETDTQSFSGLGIDGTPADIWADTDRGLIRLPDGRLLLAGEDHVKTQVNMIFVGDTLSLDRLTIEAGMKEVLVSRDGSNGVPGPQYKAIINNAEPLPRLAARYQIDPADQIFASVTTNFRTPSEATLFDAYYAGAVYAAANTSLKPEYSISEELGYRYQSASVTASVSVFNYNFTDRQIATIVGGNQVMESINAGGQTSRGIDIEAGTRPVYHVSPYISGEYLHATIDNDLTVGADTLATAGKTAIRSPRLQGAVGLNYDDGTLFGTLGVKYVGGQYATFTDDEKIPGHTQVDMGFGYRLPAVGLVARPELKVNFINLTDANFLAGVAAPTSNARDTVGRGGTLIPGMAPTYYLAGGFAVILTARQAF